MKRLIAGMLLALSVAMSWAQTGVDYFDFLSENADELSQRTMEIIRDGDNTFGIVDVDYFWLESSNAFCIVYTVANTSSYDSDVWQSMLGGIKDNLAETIDEHYGLSSFRRQLRAIDGYLYLGIWDGRAETFAETLLAGPDDFESKTPDTIAKNHTCGVDYFDMIDSNRSTVIDTAMDQIRENGNMLDIQDVDIYYDWDRHLMCIVYDALTPEKFDDAVWERMFDRLTLTYRDIVDQYYDLATFYRQLDNTGSGYYYAVRNARNKAVVADRRVYSRDIRRAK